MTTPIAQGPVDVTVGHEEVPTFTFRGNELIGFLWHVYALARIGDAIKDMPGMQKEADPMEDQEAQNELIRGWIDELQALPCRYDGTVEFTDDPWIVNVTPNAKVSGGGAFPPSA